MTVQLPPIEEIEKKIGIPFEKWARDCHHISYQLVKSDLFPLSRVARGRCRGVTSQHSWVVIGDDCYDPEAEIVDPTLWSYDPTVDGIWTGTLKDGRHSPHGAGLIWDHGRPPEAVAEPIELAVPVSRTAQFFLDLCGPLDEDGWSFLAHAPVQGWPAAEIIAAMDDTPRLSFLIPIDILGMITDKNPGGAYLK